MNCISLVTLGSNTKFDYKLGIAILMGIGAATMSFQCNELGDGIAGTILQILYTMVAFLLGGIYIVYYMVVHWLGNTILQNAGFVGSCPGYQKK